jgi:hypothetical protein
MIKKLDKWYLIAKSQVVNIHTDHLIYCGFSFPSTVDFKKYFLVSLIGVLIEFVKVSF